MPILGPGFGPILHSEEMAAWGLDRHPLVADPYEGRSCQVLGSKLEQGGEGLFAKREVGKAFTDLYLCWNYHKNDNGRWSRVT